MGHPAASFRGQTPRPESEAGPRRTHVRWDPTHGEQPEQPSAWTGSGSSGRRHHGETEMSSRTCHPRLDMGSHSNAGPEPRGPPRRLQAFVRCGGRQGHGVHRPAPKLWSLSLSMISNVPHRIARQDCCPLALPHWCLPLYPFNSFFSAVRKRQSVPWAMSLWGLRLIIPTSWRRRA